MATLRGKTEKKLQLLVRIYSPAAVILLTYDNETLYHQNTGTMKPNYKYQCFGSGTGRIRSFKPFTEKNLEKKLELGRIRIPRSGSADPDPDPHQNEADPKH